MSRRTYENERAKRQGWRNWYDYQKTRRGDEYNRLLNIGITNKGLSRKDVGVESKFSTLSLAVRKARRDNQADLFDPDGPLADLLVYVGLRQPDDYWYVGETP